MADLFDRTATLDIPCPHCGYEIQETIGRLEQDPELICPSCASRINIDGSELRDSLRELERELSRIPREITIKL